MSNRKKDVIDWKDDVLTGIELAIAVVMGFLFFTYLEDNPDIAALLQPATLGTFIISFGVFLLIFLIIKWVNREKV